MPIGPAREPAMALLRTMERERRIDLSVPADQADPRLTIDYLYGPARGQMFGVLVVRDQSGNTGVLKAFSGQYNSLWQVDGWVDPLLDVQRFYRETRDAERHIKRLGRDIVALPDGSPQRRSLVAVRKKASQTLMREIHGMFMVSNFRGERVPLPQAVYGSEGIPTGTGDCCAPKLLNHAAMHGLIPLGLAEFYCGRTNRSETRHHGEIYPSCLHKCGRILGYMVCGLEERE
ncbi:hypothetical protein [Pseudodesulfovibrio sp. JC047]|uniref:hypothetical protein n=1 Tax=Pseudodesulfovibrio sp. JC047 TaxID=2683199 RepID=UPI0031BA5FD0